MRLTKKNYYTTKNQYLSSSKLKDYLIDPYYFYQRHVTGEIQRETTDPMIIGSGVDTILTDSAESFIDKFKVVERRNRKNPPKNHFEINETQNQLILNISDAVADTSVYQDIIARKFISQKILKHDKQIGMFPGVAGIPDWFKVYKRSKRATIIDLKTAASVEEHKFRYQCDDLNYYLQQGKYQMLVGLNYEGIETYRSFILAVTNKPPHLVRLFELDQSRINAEKIYITQLLDEISKIKEFKTPDINWQDAIRI